MQILLGIAVIAGLVWLAIEAPNFRKALLWTLGGIVALMGIALVLTLTT